MQASVIHLDYKLRPGSGQRMGRPSEAASLRVSVFHWREWAQVAPVWAQLELGAPRPRFF